MLRDIPAWARPAAKTGIILGTISVFLLFLGAFLAFVVPGVGNWIGDGPILVLAALGGAAFVGAQMCAVVIWLQGEARGKWR